MYDLRDFKGVIREAVRKIDHRDVNWHWKVKAISRDKAQIGWGYLDYLEEKKNFSVEISETKDMGTAVVGTAPNDAKVILFVGDKRWDDVKTVDEGIEVAIISMAQYAHATY